MLSLNAKYGFDTVQNRFSVRKKGEDGKERGALPMRIKTFTPHQLRHTFCTLLYDAGIDVLTARDQMGHSEITTTLSIYTHLDKQHRKKSMEKFNVFLDASNMQVKKSNN